MVEKGNLPKKLANTKDKNAAKTRNHKVLKFLSSLHMMNSARRTQDFHAAFRLDITSKCNNKFKVIIKQICP
jgi:hypothetical protein